MTDEEIVEEFSNIKVILDDHGKQLGDAFCAKGHGSKCTTSRSCFCTCHKLKNEREERALYERLKAKYEPKRNSPS